MTHAGSPRATRRLIAVYSDDPSRRYAWLPRSRPGDITVTLDGIAHADLRDRAPLSFDELESWTQRSQTEHHIAELLRAINAHPAIAAIDHRGYRLIDFAELRLRQEVARLLRGWTLARAGSGASELICDPAVPPALLMGLRAGLGLDPAATPYVIPPALPGSALKRALARPPMRALAALSRPRDVRIAAVAAGKLMLAIAALSSAELRALDVGVMPFPALDHGNSAVLALRRRLPLLGTDAPRGVTRGPAVRLREPLDLVESEQLDRALTLLVERLLAAAAGELEQAVAALAGLDRARSLTTLLLPSAAYGASRLLIEWAHKRGVRVGAMQHGIYVFREFDGGDRLADVVFGWGAGTAEQIACWPDPRPTVMPVGIPGAHAVPTRSSRNTLGRVLIATSSTVDTPIAPATFCESFIDVIAPGLRLLVGAGVELELRPHPNEDAERYQRLLNAQGLDVRLGRGGPFAAAVARADLLVSSTSSVAFEAAALGLPVLMWLGGVPPRVRREHLVVPWTDSAPAMFEEAQSFELLARGLLEAPTRTLGLAHELSTRLARYAEPFDPVRFATALRALRSS